MYIYIYISIYIRRPLQSSERVRLHLLAYNIQSLSNSHPSKLSPEEDISPGSPGGQAAEIEESYPPGTQAAGIQDLGARMLRSYHLIILSSSLGDLLARNSPPQDATGRPGFWPQPSANLYNSVLPPAQECQIAYLGTLAEPVEPTCSNTLARTTPRDTTGDQRPPKLAGTIPSDTTGDQRPLKCNPNWD